MLFKIYNLLQELLLYFSMKKIISSTTVFLSICLSIPNIALADLRKDFSSQSQRSWSNAQYEASNGTRIYVDNQGYIHVTSDGDFWFKGAGRVGYITSRRHNTCYFGTTAACLNNIVETKTQVAIEGNELVRYTKTGGGDTSRYVVGTKR